MKHTQALGGFVFLGCIAGLGLGACNADLDLVLGGKQCGPNGECVDGFVCDNFNVCVLPSQLGAGAGGQGPVGGSGGANAAGAAGTRAADGGRGGTAGRGGSVTLGGTAGTGEPDRDAGIIVGQPEPTDASCGIVVYRDSDGDGIGALNDSTVGCPEPGWVTQQGDCRDDQSDVFPGQTEFFSTPFPALGAPGGVSFDYDCSLGEVGDPDNVLGAAPPTCTGLLVCQGSGFLPLSPPRSGDGIEPLCGSAQVLTCAGLVCAGTETTVPANQVFRCK